MLGQRPHVLTETAEELLREITRTDLPYAVMEVKTPDGFTFTMALSVDGPTSQDGKRLLDLVRTLMKLSAKGSLWRLVRSTH